MYTRDNAQGPGDLHGFKDAFKGQQPRGDTSVQHGISAPAGRVLTRPLILMNYAKTESEAITLLFQACFSLAQLRRFSFCSSFFRRQEQNKKQKNPGNANLEVMRLPKMLAPTVPLPWNNGLTQLET
ncbi:hypothetical protein PoB_003558400 [Plakobranchus ocellatus]|uniref:Uncharacterized protein n=1 Tax=Plakobranchus ocellatus TaxID=259542 RepID=A0AAV4AMR6_9GAST|nr:hypothetical protein PoB_003558400 [Plakobranchus ocellatus]